jgi:phosphatidylglycerophosphate synthase
MSVAHNVAKWLVALNTRFFNWLIEPLAKVLEPHTGNVIVRNIPNAISVGRSLVSVLVAWQIYHASSGAAKWGWIGVIALLMASDGFDGALARRLDIVSRFGQMADPFADKVLIGGLIIGLALKFELSVFGLLVTFLLAIEAGNAIAGPIGAYYAQKLGHPEQAGASIWGKVKFASECLLVVLGWSLLSSREIALPTCLILICLAAPLSLRSLWGYTKKIRVARRISRTTSSTV